MDKHTPGPWVHYSNIEQIRDIDGNTIVYELNANCADGRLIAAAPDLLHSLIELLQMCKRQTDFNDDGDGAMFERCSNSIAKAIGDANG